MNDTARLTIAYAIDDLKNQLKIDRQQLEHHRREVVSCQAKVNQGEHKIAELQTALEKMGNT